MVRAGVGRLWCSWRWRSKGRRAAVLLGAVVLATLAFAPAATAFDAVDRFLALGTGGEGGQHNTPRGVAVSQSGAGAADAGDLYVADQGNQRVQVFAADGSFKFAFGRDVVASGALGDTGTGFERCTLAIACKPGVVGTLGGEFGNPQGVAIDQSTGDVYVKERASSATSGTPSTSGNPRVQQFDAAGNFIRAWGWGVATGAAQFEVCTVATTCQQGLTGLGVGQMAQSGLSGHTGIAVSPVDGDVFVADPGASAAQTRRLLRFDGDGGSPQVVGGATQFASTSHPQHVAVDAAGVVYADNSATSHALVRYDSVGQTFLSSLNVASVSSTASTATTALAADPSTGNLLVARNAAVGVLELATPGGAASHVGTHAEGLGIVPQGLGVHGAAHRLYVSTNSGTPGHGVYAFDADGTGTDIAATDVAGTSATATTLSLAGTVDPDGGLVRYRFRYSADGLTYASTPLAVTGTAGQVTAQVTGLDPNTLYRVRLEVEKILGPANVASAVSPDALAVTSATAPEVVTLGSAARTQTSAELRATVDPNGSSTTYRFEYGPAGGSFSGRIPVPDAVAGTGNTADLVVQHLAGLLPDTAYHYRVVATSPSGASTGAPVEFRTRPVPASAPPLGARAYELVSPADKVGGAGVGVWGGGLVAAAAQEGRPAERAERFAASATLGSVLLDSATAYASDWALSERTARGWTSRSPVSHAATYDQGFKFVQSLGASDDLSTMMWSTGSNGGPLRPFAEIAGWPDITPVFAGDWESRWELLAPTRLDQVNPDFQTAPPGLTALVSPLVAADGSAVLATARVDGSGRALVGGLAGPGDPGAPGSGTGLLTGRLVYLADLSEGLSDSFDGNSRYANVGVCAGGTTIPVRESGGTLAEAPCPAPLPGHESRLISDRGAAVNAVNAQTDDGNALDNAVSSNGSRAFFLSPDPQAAGVPAAGCATDALCTPQLYVRQRNGDGSVVTRWISKAEPALFGSQDASLSGPVRFAGASVDGDRVFFQTTSPLTVDDPNGAGAPTPGGVTTGTASSASWDLYMFELADGSDPTDPLGGARLTRVSAGPTGASDCNVVNAAGQGSLRFVADDGAKAYFTCSAPLAGMPEFGSGSLAGPSGAAATTDTTNLYHYDSQPEDGAWRFVTRLPKAGALDACATTAKRRAGLLAPLAATTTVGLVTGTSCVRGTSDGSFVTFWTLARLTLDDPDTSSLDGYAYDADRDELTRLTAPQGGVGGSYVCIVAGTAAGTPCHGDNGFGGNASATQLGVATEPAEPGDRIALFQTRSRLVPEDVDDAYDVYQWRNGELELLSTGNSSGGGGVGGTGGAFYMGNDVTGRDVYMATNDRLAWQDFDAVQDIYTARVGGGIPQPPPPVICATLAGGCQGEGPGPPLPVDADTARPVADGDADPGSRTVLAARRPSAATLRRAARSGRLAVAVRTTVAGRVTILARGRVAGRDRALGRGARAVRAGGAVPVTVRLDRRARRALRGGRTLRVTLSVRQAGARPQTLVVRLRGVAR